VAFAMFILVGQMNRLAPAPAPPPAPPEKDCPYCLSRIPLAATKCAHCTADLKAA